MPSLVFQISWPTLGIVLLIFGLAPGVALRLIVLAFPRDDPRRRELLGDLYRVPWFERPFWVAGKLEVALFEGLPNRAARGKALRRAAAEHAVLLFAGDDLSPYPESIGYRGPTACAAAGVTYRQLAYWARTGLVEPQRASCARAGAALQLPRHPPARGHQAPARYRRHVPADSRRRQPHA
jgi:hypothetical protein